MTRNLKIFGLAFLAMFTLAAVAASAASADKLISEIEKTIITGEDTPTTEAIAFHDHGVNLSCHTVKYTGTTSAKSVTTVNLVPAYNGCTTSFGNATVKTEGCEYVIHTETTEVLQTDGVTKVKEAPVGLVCEAGKAIVAEAACPITFEPDQTGFEGVTFKNLTNHGPAGKTAIELKYTLDKIKYETPNTFACNLAGLPRTGNDGTMTGEASFTGYEDKDPSPLATYKSTPVTEGAQVGISVEVT